MRSFIRQNYTWQRKYKKIANVWFTKSSIYMNATTHLKKALPERQDMCRLYKQA